MDDQTLDDSEIGGSSFLEKILRRYLQYSLMKVEREILPRSFYIYLLWKNSIYIIITSWWDKTIVTLNLVFEAKHPWTIFSTTKKIKTQRKCIALTNQFATVFTVILFHLKELNRAIYRGGSRKKPRERQPPVSTCFDTHAFFYRDLGILRKRPINPIENTR